MAEIESAEVIYIYIYIYMTKSIDGFEKKGHYMKP